MTYLILKHLHSGVRWLVLVSLVLAIANAGFRLAANTKHSDRSQKIALVAMALLHVQLLLGLIIYFISPKVVFSATSMANPMLRFFLVEHISLMLIAVILITLGFSLSKRAKNDSSRYLRVLIFYFSGLLLILLAIPWPWNLLGAGWV